MKFEQSIRICLFIHTLRAILVSEDAHVEFFNVHAWLMHIGSHTIINFRNELVMKFDADFFFFLLFQVS